MNVFELFAVLKLNKDDYDKKLDEAESEGGGKLSKIGKALGGAAKAVGVGIGAAATGVSALTKQSVEAYADYEQLTGGVETLFKDSSELVMMYANNAYKNAGLSANQYMDTVTSFSASLISSLDGDTVAAAEAANMAIVDMSDNANKMGTDIGSIQNAYQGFAKQNYTMLDNLKLGYGGTKEEMQRLLDDAEKLTGKEFDLSNFGDIVEAIHAIQDEWDITGTTAKEGSETISGSIGMTKAAWENLVTGISNPDADIGKLIGELVKSAGFALENLLPTLGTALQGVGTMVAELAPQLSETIITLVTDSAPQLIESAGTMIFTLVNALIDNLPKIIETGLEIILSLAEGIADNLHELIPTIVKTVVKIAETLTKPENLTKILNAGIDILASLTLGILKAMPDLLLGIVQVFKNIGITLGEKLGELYIQYEEWWGEAKEKIKELFNNAVEKVKTWGKDLIDKFVSGLKENFHKVVSFISNIGQKIKDLLGFSEPKEGPLSDFHTYAPDMIDLFIKGLRDNEGKLRAQVAESFDFGSLATSPELNAESYGVASAYGSNGNDYMAADIRELLQLFKSGKAQIGATIENTRELGRAIYA